MTDSTMPAVGDNTPVHFDLFGKWSDAEVRLEMDRLHEMANHLQDAARDIERGTPEADRWNAALSNVWRWYSEVALEALTRHEAEKAIVAAMKTADTDGIEWPDE